MTETAIIESVRAAGTAATAAQPGVGKVADPAAVDAFQRAMSPEGPSPIPFAQQVSETWHSAQNTYQDHLHRMTALSETMKMGHVSATQLSELQYEVVSLSFQQEIVTNIAKKASDAVSTLVKNG